MPHDAARYDRHLDTRRLIPPPLLYKYRSIEQARRILTERAVWWASPLTFNDPQDAQWDVFAPLYRPEAIQAEQQLLRDLLQSKIDINLVTVKAAREAIWKDKIRLLSMSVADRYRAVEQIVSRSAETPERVAAKFGPRRKDILGRGRVLCLCDEPDSTLMWTHYADGHKGVAIGFDSRLLEEAWKIPAEKVQYTGQPPDLIDATQWTRFVFGMGPAPKWNRERDWVLYKHDSYAYEKEWRFCAIAKRGDTKLGQAFNLPDGAVRKIVFGSRASEAERKPLLHLLAKTDPSAEIVNLQSAPSGYGRVVNDRE
jgi:hypothetical protein